MNKKQLMSMGCIAMLCAGATAQKKPLTSKAQQQDSIGLQTLDEVVVSDSRFQLKRENSGKTIIKIGPQELERNQGRSVAEIINTKSGLEVNGSRSNAGQNISVFARGGNNRQVLVLIDGIQVSDPSNVNAEYDLRLLNASQIESIEISKGAASTLYGNAAATAVINITTKKAKKGLSLEVLSSIGTNQSQENQNYDGSDFSNTVSLNAKHHKLSILASGGHQFTDGLSAALGDEADAFSRIDGQLKLGYQFSDKFQLSAAAFYNKLNNDFDNAFPVADADFTSFSEQSRFSLSSEYSYKNGSIHFNGAFTAIDRRFASDFPTSFDSESLVFDVFNRYSFDDKLFAIAGVNIIDNRTFIIEDQNATTVDPYVNAVFISEFGLNVNAGARLNNHSEYGSNFIYSVNPSYRISTEQGYIKFLGSYATSFIAPNLSQLFGPFGPNPDLEPEEDTTIEGGLEYRPSDKLRISALYFDRQEDDRIEFVTINPDAFESEFQNNPESVRFYGLEVELEAAPIKNMTVTANYTYTDAENGLALRIPENKVNASLGYTFKTKTFASVSYQYVSERTDIDFATFSNVALESFGLVDFNIRHNFSTTFGVFATASNLFNTDYFEIFNFTTRGRNIRLGMRLTL